MATFKTSLLATSLCGTPVALQIYLIVQARNADSRDYDFAWPIAHEPNRANHENRACNVERAPERYTASMSKHVEKATESTMHFYHPGTDTAALPAAGLLSQKSPEMPAGRKSIQEGKATLPDGRREIHEHDRRAISCIAKRGFLQANPSQDDRARKQKGQTQKPTTFKSLEDLREERQRYAISPETATAISRARNSPARAYAAGVLPPSFVWPTRKEYITRESAIVSEMLTGQPCHEGDMGPFVEKRKDSAISIPPLPERKVSQLGLKYVEKMVWLTQPTQAAVMMKAWEHRIEVARREQSAGRSRDSERS